MGALAGALLFVSGVFSSSSVAQHAVPMGIAVGIAIGLLFDQADYQRMLFGASFGSGLAILLAIVWFPEEWLFATLTGLYLVLSPFVITGVATLLTRVQWQHFFFRKPPRL